MYKCRICMYAAWSQLLTQFFSGIDSWLLSRKASNPHGVYSCSSGFCLDWQPGVLLKGMPVNQCETEEIACRRSSFMCKKHFKRMSWVCRPYSGPTTKFVGLFILVHQRLFSDDCSGVQGWLAVISIANLWACLGTSAHFAVFNLMSLASSFSPPPPPLFPHLCLN